MNWQSIFSAMWLTAAIIVHAALVAHATTAKNANTNWLLKEYSSSITVSASSTFHGWGPEKLVDGNKQTSWFSANNDSFAKGKRHTWVQVSFPQAETIKRVTLLGNREPAWTKHYSIKAGKFEFFDSKGKLIASFVAEACNEFYDIEFTPRAALGKVQSIRFSSLGDQGNENFHGDVAIGEIQVE